MGGLAIRDAERMRLILEAFSHIDNARCSTASHQNLINYSHCDLAPDEKLLTHWLCYITDRRMPFQRIWDVGGYVLSHLVRSYTRELERDVSEVLNKYVRRHADHIFLECPLETENRRLEGYGLAGPNVRFASRYMPEDLALIYRTLEVLHRVSQRSLSMYIADTIRPEKDHWRAIRRVAAALNGLTYAAGGPVSAQRFDEALARVFREVADFEPTANTGKELFGRKRLWCAFRDYLKSPEFNDAFVAALRSIGYQDADQWHRTNAALRGALSALELPGDVWNNAAVFRRGLFSPYLRNEKKSWDMPRTIRAIYDIVAHAHDTCFYPEQLDVSFDFVPRMCQKTMCDVCPFGGGIERVCHQQPTRLCSVLLVSCGYRYECDPASCALKKDSVRGFCRNWEPR